MELSIVIVNYNVKHYIEQCLYSIRCAVKEIETQILVVDNASTDGSFPFLEEKFHEVVFIKNEENEGFAKANNRVLKLVKGKYLLYLNPDTLITANSISASISYLKKQESCGAIGVRMIDGLGRYLPESKRGQMNLWNSFSKFMGLARLFPHSPFFAGYYLGHLDEQKRHQVKVLSGAFMMMRTELAKDLGGFDERFFMYGEDIEMGYAIEEKGYQNIYLGDLTILHFKGESTKYDTKYVNRFFGAMKLFLDKRGTRIENIISKPIIFLIKNILLLMHSRRLVKRDKIQLSKQWELETSQIKERIEKRVIQGRECWIHKAEEGNTYDEIIEFINQHPDTVHYINWVESSSLISYDHVISVN